LRYGRKLSLLLGLLLIYHYDKDFLEGRDMEPARIEELLRLLEGDGRLSPDTIATMMGVTVEEVSKAIAKLEADKVILKYPALINWDSVEGNGNVKAMIEVKVTPQREVGFDDIASRIYKFPEVQSVYLMSGSYDLSIVIEGASIKDVALFVSQKLSTLDNVISTATHFILKKYKHDGVIFNEGEEDKRMLVAP
jgi:DNA-binding Lrp family transcriptional regulator